MRFADFGAYLTNEFADAEAVRLQQAAILAGVSGLTCYVPYICYAWIRNQHYYASRALAEALPRGIKPYAAADYRQDGGAEKLG